MMYELTVEAEFCAAHAIVIRGEREALHGHNFRVVAAVVGRELDGEGLLIDFHGVEAALRGVVGAWDNRNLNECAAFSERNPTAEEIARTIYEQLSERLGKVNSGTSRASEGGTALRWVRVTEAPGCAVRYGPGEFGGGG